MKIEVTQCSMCKHYSEEQYCEIWQQYITNDTFYCACGAKADRKDELQVTMDCTKCDRYWNCQGQCDEMPQIEDEQSGKE